MFVATSVGLKVVALTGRDLTRPSHFAARLIRASIVFASTTLLHTQLRGERRIVDARQVREKKIEREEDDRLTNAGGKKAELEADA